MDNIDWSSLPCGILVTILENLSTVDLVRSKAVCRHWNSTPTRKRCIPWLLHTARRGYTTNFEVDNLFEKCSLPEKNQFLGYVHRILGSCENGWLLYEDRLHVLLGFNVRTKERFEAPCYSTMWKIMHVEYGVNDVRYHLQNPKSGFRWISRIYSYKGYGKALTYPCDRTTGNKKNVTVVIDILSQLLAFAVEGDVSWTVLVTETGGFQELMYSDGLFYALNSNGHVVKCDLSDPSSPKIKSFIAANFPLPPVNQIFNDYNIYSFELSGEIWYLIKHRYMTGYEWNNDVLDRTYSVKVLLAKLVRLDDESYEWMEMSGLGDHSLFVGVNNSMCVLAANHRNLPRNHIYFDSVIGFQFHEEKLYQGRGFDLNGGYVQEYKVPGGECFMGHAVCYMNVILHPISFLYF